MLLSPVPWLFLLPPCFLFHTPVSWFCHMVLSSVSWLFHLSPCLLIHAPVSLSCLMLLPLLSPGSSSSLPASCFMLLSPVFCLMLTSDVSRLSLLSPGFLINPTSCFFLLFLTHGSVSSYKVLMFTVAWRCLFLHALAASYLIVLSPDPAPCSCLCLLRHASCLLRLSPALPHCSFHMILSEGPASWLCLLSPASHPKVYSTCSILAERPVSSIFLLCM